jgi:hypothetical protein
VKLISFVTLLLYERPTSYISRITNQDNQSSLLPDNFLILSVTQFSVQSALLAFLIPSYLPFQSSDCHVKPEWRSLGRIVVLTSTYIHFMLHSNASTSTTHSISSRRSSKSTKSKTPELKLCATSSGSSSRKG